MHSTLTVLSKNKFWTFLAALSIFAMICGGIATSKYGAGISSDATKYLAVAQNLAAGKGLYDHRGGPLLAWPPLYPMLLAGLSLLTGLDVFIAGWYFNILVLGLNVFLSGVIFHRVFADRPLYAYLASLFVFLSIASLRIHANISSDPFYLTLTLGFLVAVHGYIAKRSYRAFAWMVLFGLLGPLQRYVGLAIAVTAEAVILVENRRSIRTWLRDGFILGLASILPIAWWLLIHNIMMNGSLYGVGPQTVDIWMNTSLALTKMLHWFVPYLTILMPVLRRPLIPLGILVLILVWINRKSPGQGRLWLQALSSPAVYPALVYGIVYFVAVALTAVTLDQRDLFADRYYVILLVPAAILLLITFDSLIRPHLHVPPRQVQMGLVCLFAFWSVYPVYSFQEYLREALVKGEPSGANMFNNQAYHEMTIVPEMQKLREEHPDLTFYSNYSDAVWFYTRRPVKSAPTISDDLSVTYAGWPHSKPGYLIWFEPNEYKHYLPPGKIAEFADLQLVFDGKGGKIYSVQAR